MTVVLDTPDQIENYRRAALAQAIRLFLNTGMMVTRGMNGSRLRDLVSGITGKSYPRSRKGLEVALADLEALR